MWCWYAGMWQCAQAGLGMLGGTAQQQAWLQRRRLSSLDTTIGLQAGRGWGQGTEASSQRSLAAQGLHREHVQAQPAQQQAKPTPTGRAAHPS